MTTGHARLLLFVLLAAGGLGFLLGRSTAPEPEVDADPVETAAPTRPAPPPTDFAPGSLGEALAAIPVEPVEGGDGEITGVVKTKDGAPLEGVRIIANQHRPRHGSRRAPGEVPVDPDLVEQVRDLVRDHHHLRSARRETVSGADGRFRLTGIGTGDYYVAAYATGYRIHSRDAWVSAGEKVEMTARLVATLEVRVVGPDGTDAFGANVRAEPAGGGRSFGMTFSEHQQSTELTPGEYRVTAWSKQRDAKSDAVTVQVGSAAGPVVLHLKTVPGVRGRVVFPEGEAQGNPYVYLLRWSKKEDPTAREVRRRGKSQVAWSHEGFVYTFADPGKGKHFLALIIHDRIVDSARIELTGGMIDRDLTVPAPDPEQFLVVTVLGPDGKPVTEARFSVGHRTANRRSSRGGRARNLGEGRFRVSHYVVDDDREREGEEYTVEVRVEELGTKTIVYDPATTRELTVNFEAPATLTVRVPNAAEGELGEALALHLDSTPDESGQSTSRSAKIEDGTTATFGSVSPGEYELRLTLKVEEHFGSVRLLTKPITLTSGRNEDAISVPPLYETTIAVPKDLEKQSFRIGPARRGDGRWSLREKPEDGRIRLPALPAGRYQVMPSKGMMGSGMMEFTLPGPSVIQFKAAPLNALRVSIRDPEGALAKAGFRDGDLIVGARGKVFENLGQLSGTLMGGGKEVPLLIDRGGRRVTVKIDIQALMGDDRNHGGSMDPASRSE